MRGVMFLALLLAPAVALAAKHCEYRLPQDADVPLVHAGTVVFDMGRHSLTLEPGAAAGQVELRGDACASSVANLQLLKVDTQHAPDRVVIKASGGDDVSPGWMGRHYADIALTVKVPADLHVEVQLDSGTLIANDVPELAVKADSGSVQIRGASGHVKLDLGSGRATVDGAGQLAIGSLGKGTLRAQNVGGDVTVGSIDKGRLTLRDIKGNVQVDDVVSGTVDADTVGGNLTVHHVGEDGSVKYDHVDGTVSVPTTTR